MMKKSSSSFNFSNTNKNKRSLSKHHNHHGSDENKNLHAINDKNYEKWEKFREKKVDMTHNQNVERQLRHDYNNQNFNDSILHNIHPRRKVSIPPTGRSLTSFNKINSH